MLCFVLVYTYQQRWVHPDYRESTKLASIVLEENAQERLKRLNDCYSPTTNIAAYLLRLDRGRTFLFSGNTTGVISSKHLVEVLERERIVGEELFVVPVMLGHTDACTIDSKEVRQTMRTKCTRAI